jgi:hypothetical protein
LEIMSFLTKLFGSKDVYQEMFDAGRRSLDGTLSGSSLDDAGKKKVTDFFQGRFDNDSVVMSDDAIGAAVRNVEAGQEAGIGLAAQSGRGTGLTNAFGGGGNILQTAAGAGLLGVMGAGIAGGDKAEGAMYGALAGLSIGGASKVLAKNMVNMEETFMKGILKSDYAEKGIIEAGTELKNIKNQNLTMKELGLSNEEKPLKDIINERVFKNIKRGDTKTSSDIEINLTSSEMRSQNLNKLQNMDTANMGTVDKYKRDLLLGKSTLNVGRVGRVSTMAGSALMGMGLSSSNRDHRRGFNRNRGNRV